jgi:hypothetical protein
MTTEIQGLMLLPEMIASIVNGMIAIPCGYIREAKNKTD